MSRSGTGGGCRRALMYVRHVDPSDPRAGAGRVEGGGRLGERGLGVVALWPCGPVAPVPLSICSPTHQPARWLFGWPSPTARSSQLCRHRLCSIYVPVGCMYVCTYVTGSHWAWERVLVCWALSSLLLLLLRSDRRVEERPIVEGGQPPAELCAALRAVCRCNRSRPVAQHTTFGALCGFYVVCRYSTIAIVN